MSAVVFKNLKRDKLLQPALKDYAIQPLRRQENIALYLCLSIISQQLSTRVANIISDRFLELIGPTDHSCERILAIEKSALRSIGLSESKAAYIHNVCAFFAEQGLDDTTLHSMNNEDVLETLIQIKGVGNWTIQMLLMFAMAREDVFAPDDLGIQKAMIDLYSLQPSSPKELKKSMSAISQQWQPYRTYACLALWRWNDKKKKGG
jgi:DNA-3-methyladenine glycosylase II